MKKDMANYYRSKPMTYDDLAAKFNISLPTVGKVLKELNVKPWSKFSIRSPLFVEDYFENINTERKAYFVGLLLADGNVFSGYKSKTHPPTISLSLQEQDRYIIDELKKDLRIEKKISNDGRGCYQLSFPSKKMAKDLENYSIVPKKSLVTKFPVGIDASLYPHLIRGYMDGNGSVSFYARPNRKSHTKAVRFCSGSYQFLEEMSSFLSDALHIQKVSIYKEKENLWSIAYRKNSDMESLINYMYRDATIYMKRKKEKCDLVLGEIRKYRDN